MKRIQDALDGIGGPEKLSHEELEDALTVLVDARKILAESIVGAIDHIIDDLLRYKYPERVAAVLKKRAEGRDWP